MNFKTLTFILLTFGLLLTASSAWALGSAGQEFWLGFPYPFGGTPKALLLLLSSNTNTTATVTEPGMAPVAYPIVPGATTKVVLQNTDVMNIGSDNTVTHQGIHFTAPDDITVYGIDYISAAT